VTIAVVDGKPRPQPAWLIAGLLLMAYAVIGNWLALPGYRRFLAQGHQSSNGGADLALILGASKTILWMLSFHLGAFCLSWAAIRASGDASRTFRRWFCVGAVTWIGLWIIPAWPGPYVTVFAGGGVLILLLISVAFGRAALTGEPYAGTRSEHWRIASAFFFALATWDVCGLGSVGGILHPDSTSRAANQGLVVTQTTKLIIEFVIAWALVAIATVPLGRGVSATRAPRAGSTGDGLAGTKQSENRCAPPYSPRG
jgi:hypothetical protein